MKNRDFVITGLQPWDIELGSNAKDIAQEIARHNRVLYVNTPLDYLTLLRKEESKEFVRRKEVLEGKKDPLRQITKNLWVVDFPFALYPANKIPWAGLFNWINRGNNRKMYQYLSTLLQSLQFEQIIHINDNDIYRSFYFKEMMKPAISIYYRRDNLLSVDFWKKHGSRLEPLLVNKSDLVLANSCQLAEAVKQYNPNTFNVGQGVDLSGFNPDQHYPEPVEMRGIKRPVIGYTGFLTGLRLDPELIAAMATRYPDYTFMLVGPEDQIFTHHPIHQLPNVYFTGNKDNKEIPAYIAHFDICLNPQVVNEATMGNYPRKVDEYLALGKPVIATDTPAMQMFIPYVNLCRNADEYFQAIDKIVTELSGDTSQQDRIQFAKSHSWENSVNKMYEYIEQLQ